MVKEKYVSVTQLKAKLSELAHRPYMSSYSMSPNIVHGLDAASTLQQYHSMNHHNTAMAVNQAMGAMLLQLMSALDECAIDGGQCFLCKNGPNDAEPDDTYCSSGGFKPSV